MNDLLLDWKRATHCPECHLEGVIVDMVPPGSRNLDTGEEVIAMAYCAHGGYGEECDWMTFIYPEEE